MRKLFTRSTQRALDDKGRLILPADYRASLDSASEGKFWLTCLHGRLVACLPEEWESFVERLHGVSPRSVSLVHFCAKVIGLAEELSCNQQGRVRISQPLLREAGIVPDAEGRCEVMIVGMFDRFEIWSLERFNAISIPDVSEELEARGIVLGL